VYTVVHENGNVFILEPVHIFDVFNHILDCSPSQQPTPQKRVNLHIFHELNATSH
jgi:hypothetical protein